MLVIHAKAASSAIVVQRFPQEKSVNVSLRLMTKLIMPCKTNLRRGESPGSWNVATRLKRCLIPSPISQRSKGVKVEQYNPQLV
jgi:hypothetical protein